MEDAMTNYLPAIDIMMCHLGISFEQACEQLGLSPQEQQTLDQLQKQKQTQSNRHSAPDLGINLPIALTQYLQNDLLVSC